MGDEEALVLSIDKEECGNPFDSASREKSLLAAILILALSDLRTTGECARNAVRFFLSDDESHIFSFRSICSHLALEPGRVLQIAKLSDRVHSSVV